MQITEPAPHSEEIVGRFVWAQFDLSQQNVYFLQMSPSEHSVLLFDTIFKCVHFEADNRYEVKMDVKLPLEAPWQVYEP